MILVLDSAYPYKMSYVNDWRDAWLTFAGKNGKYINLATNQGVKLLSKELNVASLIVLLHSCTADTNIWLEKVKNILTKRNCPLVAFVGNEYNSPNLSIERRLSNLEDIFPEVIASQLRKDTATWLYKDVGRKILSVPHGMPGLSQITSKTWDFAYLGFSYPSYIFESYRNRVVELVVDSMKRNHMSVKHSNNLRMSREKWMELLSKTRLTASSEAGSKYVFKTDSIWNLLDKSRTIQVSSDNRLVHLSRRLPSNVKTSIRNLGIKFGFEYGSIESNKYENSQIERILERFEYRDGTCISSRHLEAIAAGCWQILYTGEYNGLLKAGHHYTELRGLSTLAINDSVEEALEVISRGVHLEIRERMFETNSYSARVSEVLRSLP